MQKDRKEGGLRIHVCLLICAKRNTERLRQKLVTLVSHVPVVGTGWKEEDVERMEWMGVERDRSEDTLMNTIYQWEKQIQRKYTLYTKNKLTTLYFIKWTYPTEGVGRTKANNFWIWYSDYMPPGWREKTLNVCQGLLSKVFLRKSTN